MLRMPFNWRGLSLLIFLFAFISVAQAQVEMTVTVILKNQQFKPMDGVRLTFKLEGSDQTRSAVTAGGGKAKIVLDEGGKWVLNYKEVKEALVMNVPTRGTGSATRTVIYDPGKAARERASDRTGLNFVTTDQTGKELTGSGNQGICIVEVQRLDGTPLANFDVTLTSIPLRRKWKNRTDANGIVRFKVPLRQKFEIDLPGRENVNWIESSERADREAGLRIKWEPVAVDVVAEEGDTIKQSNDATAKASSTRLRLEVTMINFDRTPLENETIFFQNRATDKVYSAVSNEEGKVFMILPHGAWYDIGFEGVPRYDSLDYSGKRGIVNAELSFSWLGAKEYLRRKRIREKALARRDSLYAAGVFGSAAIELISQNSEMGMKDLKKRCEIIRENLKKDPKFFETADMPVCAVINRMGPKWQTKVIVNDLTGSMYPYMDEVLVWHELNLQLKEKKSYFFFNDGDHTPDSQKKIGATGGIYHTPGGSTGAVAGTMIETMNGGGGGDGPENDVEALIQAQKHVHGETALILVADNYSAVKDLELMTQLKVPVHVIVCGFTGKVHPDYITLAYKTGGSVHTIEEDIFSLNKKVKDNRIYLAGNTYVLSGGRFYEQ